MNMRSPWDHVGNPGANIGNPGDHIGNPGDHLRNPGDHLRNPWDHIGNPRDHLGNPGDHIRNPGDNIGNPGHHLGNLGTLDLNILQTNINFIGGIPDYMEMQSTNSEIMLRNSLPKMMDPPVNFSWVDLGAVTPAKDQVSIRKFSKDQIVTCKTDESYLFLS